MPLQGEVYVVENNPSTFIIRLERREGSNDHPGVGFRETELENLIVRMESKGGHWDALQGIWNSDALFGFAVQAILDHQARPSRLGEDRVWRRLLEMGLEGGEMPGRVSAYLFLTPFSFIFIAQLVPLSLPSPKVSLCFPM